MVAFPDEGLGVRAGSVGAGDNCVYPDGIRVIQRPEKKSESEVIELVHSGRFGGWELRVIGDRRSVGQVYDGDLEAIEAMIEAKADAEAVLGREVDFSEMNVYREGLE